MPDFPQDALSPFRSLGIRDFGKIIDGAHEQGEGVFLTQAPLHLKIEKILKIGAVIETGDRIGNPFMEVDFIDLMKLVEVRLFLEEGVDSDF